MITAVSRSRAGADYAEGKTTREGPHGRFWYAIDEYQPYLEDWAKRPEYKNWVRRGKRRTGKKRQSK